MTKVSAAMLIVVSFSCVAFLAASEGLLENLPGLTLPREGQGLSGSAEKTSDAEADQLVGKKAPGFELDLLEGGKVSLQSYEGKNVVLLDFWATWCPPCRRSLPRLVELAEEYKDKGLVFIAVDLEEDPEAVRAFLAKARLQLTVALDSDGKVARSYGVSLVPTSFVISKDGSVKAVHVGYSPEGIAKIRSEIDALLADKD